MELFCLSEKGNYRAENEDCVCSELNEIYALSVVCDGMGGAAAGQIAASKASERFITYATTALKAGEDLRIPATLISAAESANKVVYNLSVDVDDYSGMGTTLVAIYLKNASGYIVNIGDSRAYKISHQNIQRLTHDHSYVQELVDLGLLSEAEALHHPRKNLITRAVGIQKNVHTDIFETDVTPGDVFVLCTDGLSGVLTDLQILSIVQQGGGAEIIGKNLVQAAMEFGSKDNITASVIIV